MRLPDRQRITDQAPVREDPGTHGGRDVRLRADAGDVIERHSPGWYRELRERLERLPDGHPSSWQAPDQTARADPGLVPADESDIWWRPRDAPQVGPGWTDRWAADGWAGDGGAAEDVAAAGEGAGGADDPQASAPAADAEHSDAATGKRDPADEEARPAEPGQRRDAVKPARRTADSEDSGQWSELSGPLAARSRYRPWFGAAADPWFAPRPPQ